MEYNRQYVSNPKIDPKLPVRLSLTYEQMQATANLLWDFYLAIDEVKQLRTKLDTLRVEGRRLIGRLSENGRTPVENGNTRAELARLLETYTTRFLPLESYPPEANRLHLEVHDTMVNCFLSMEKSI